MPGSYTNSDENDYETNTAGLGISMDMFANMTTVNMGYTYGWDTVKNNNDSTFSKPVLHTGLRGFLQRPAPASECTELSCP